MPTISQYRSKNRERVTLYRQSTGTPEAGAVRWQGNYWVHVATIPDKSLRKALAAYKGELVMLVAADSSREIYRVIDG